MAREKGQTYTAEKKAKIILELLKEERTINQIASEYKVTVKSIQCDALNI
jgi:putative transposase